MCFRVGKFTDPELFKWQIDKVLRCALCVPDQSDFIIVSDAEIYGSADELRMSWISVVMRYVFCPHHST